MSAKDMSRANGKPLHLVPDPMAAFGKNQGIGR